MSFLRKLKKLAVDHNDLNIRFDNLYNGDTDDEENTIAVVSGIGGNENLILEISNIDEYEMLLSILNSSFSFLTIFYGIHYDNKYEISLSPVNARTSAVLKHQLNKKPILLKMPFHKNILEISIGLSSEMEDSLLWSLSELDRRRIRVIVTIEGLKNGIEEDIRNILNSVLFNLSYSYNILLETDIQDSINIRIPRRRANKTKIPTETVDVIYRKYIPELIEYFYVGEKMTYLPFNYICYFHIIEYFLDRSAFSFAAKKLKSLMIKPDFHINTDKYINQAINFFKVESTKYTSDKIKLRRVINQFIDRENLIEYLKTIELFDYFQQPASFECIKSLELPAIDFSNDSKFEESITSRIYIMRCSIIHSNPDFEESKAIPFSATPANLLKLRTEIDLIYEVARTIIIESAE